MSYVVRYIIIRILCTKHRTIRKKSASRKNHRDDIENYIHDSNIILLKIKLPVTIVINLVVMCCKISETNNIIFRV